MDFTSIIALIGGIAILLVLILRFKLPAFIALLISTLSIGLFLGMDATQIFKTVEKGMGGTLGYVATVVGLGAMFGALLEVTGSAQSIAQYLLGRFGLERASWTMLLSGFFIAIPVFFDVAFVLLIPIVSGIFYGKFIAGKIFLKSPDYFTEGDAHKKLPGVGGVLTIVLLPIFLIVLKAFFDTGFISLSSGWRSIVNFTGHPFAALIIANLLAWYFLGIRGNYHKNNLFKVASKSMEPAGTIILLTGAGGVLKQLLIDSELGLDLAREFTRLDSSIYLLAFGIAALIRVLQGSSTVAMITAAGIIAPLAPASSHSNISLALITIAIASGASIFSHVNDSGFWLVRQYLGMDERQTFKSWTLMTTILGVTGLFMVLLLSIWIG